MKTSRLLLAAIPMGALAVGAVALGKWSYRNVFGSSSPARENQRAAGDGTSADDRITPIPGSVEEVAEVAQAMAKEGGPVLVTEVAEVGDDEVVVAEALLVPNATKEETAKEKT